MPPALPDVSDLQLLFAQYNYAYFEGRLPAYRIAYNGRFRDLAGRITYDPPTIELSPKHLRDRPEALRETLLHEMIHAWLFARGENPGHTAAFKKKMRELGLSSIYHDLGKAAPDSESARRYILRCEKCTGEWLRKRKPSPNLRCGRCRLALSVYEVAEVRPVTLTRAASRSPLGDAVDVSPRTLETRSSEPSRG